MVLYLPTAYDQEKAPASWVWTDREIQANEILNDHFCSGGIARPSVRKTFNAPFARVPAGAGAGYIPLCFPDDSWDLALLGAKYEYIIRCHQTRVQYLADLLSVTGRRLQPDTPLAVLEGAQHEVFAPKQYLHMANYLVNECPEYPTSAELRAEMLDYWFWGCFTDDAATVQQFRALEDFALYLVTGPEKSLIEQAMMGA